jgi:hypothetical protein
MLQVYQSFKGTIWHAWSSVIRRHVPEQRYLHSHRFETPKSPKQSFLRITDARNVLWRSVETCGSCMVEQLGGGESDRNVKATTYLHLVRRSRISGVVFLCSSVRRGAFVQRRAVAGIWSRRPRLGNGVVRVEIWWTYWHRDRVFSMPIDIRLVLCTYQGLV